MEAINKLEIAKMIDHSLLHPTMDDQTLREGIEEDGYFLSRHLIDVLDGNAQPVVTLETAKKHMEMIFKCREAADHS